MLVAAMISTCLGERIKVFFNCLELQSKHSKANAKLGYVDQAIPASRPGPAELVVHWVKSSMVMTICSYIIVFSYVATLFYVATASAPQNLIGIDAGRSCPSKDCC